MRFKLVAAILFMLAAALTAQNTDFDKLIRPSLEKWKERPMWFAPRSVFLSDMPFSYETEVNKTKFDGDKRVKIEQSVKQDVVIVDGVVFPRVLEHSEVKDPDRFLESQEKTQAEQQKKLEKRQNSSESERRKYEEAKEKRQDQRRMFWSEFLKAFTFKAAGHENLNGRPSSIFSFTPLASYKKSGVEDTEIFPNIAGKFWIDDQDVEIARLEMEVLKDVKFGFGVLGKAYKGTRFQMDLAPQVEDRWLPVRSETDLYQRLFLFREHEVFTVKFGNYRRFGSDVKLEVVHE